MTRSVPFLTGFNAGEWSPTYYGRTDLDKYRKACRRLRNMIGLAMGPATRRPGTRHAAETKSSGVARPIPFKFSVEQSYIIEAGDLYFRFYKDDGRIEDPPGTPVEIASPYGLSDLDKIKWAQSADVLYLVDGAHWPQKLTRFSHTSWTIGDFVPNGGPYLDLNTTAATITPSATTGSGITLTASDPLFQTGHVGSYWRIEEKSGHLNYDAWVSGKAYSAGAKVKSDDKVYVAAGAGTSGTRDPLHDSGTESDGGVNWTYQHNGHGFVKITAVTDETQATADVIKTLPDTVATTKWREGAWSAVRGYPTTVTFSEERLIFAGAGGSPQTFDLSASNAYNVFEPTDNGTKVLDDTAMRYTLSDGEENGILWAASASALVLGTAGGLHVVRASNLNEALKPDNITARPQPQAGVGCADIAPAKTDDAIVFVQRAGRELYAVKYDYASDSYVADPLSLFAPHLGRAGFRSIAWQAKPWGLIWAPRLDGKLPAFTYLPQQDVFGWHLHELGGRDAKVLGAAAIPYGGQDRLWLVAERTINGATRRYVEFIEDEFWPDDESSIEYGLFVDSGLTYDGWNGDPAKTLTLSGGPPWTIGASKTLAAGGHAPFSPTSVGKVYRFREIPPAVPDATDASVWPAVSAKITGYSSATQVTVELLNDIPTKLQNAAVSWWGAAATTLSGLDHLEGETIQLLVDGAAHPDRTVAGGAVTLDAPAVVVQAGLGYVSELETMNLEGGSPDGTSQGRPQRVAVATVRLFATLGAEVGYDADHLETVLFRTEEDAMGVTPGLFTGDKRVSFPKGWDREARILVRQTQPLPLTVVGVAPVWNVSSGA